MVSALAQSRRVLSSVGQSASRPTGQRIVDRIAGKEVANKNLLSVMRDAVEVVVSKETGFLTITVVLSDSALAREVVQAVVTETRRAYVETSKAQATQLRLAQDIRVDSASRVLKRAHQSLQTLLSTNRAFQQYSAKVSEQQSLQRDLTIAELVYTKAINDRESAIAKELEQTPVLVVMDPLPDSLPFAPRHSVLILLVLLSFTCFGSLLVILVKESCRLQAIDHPQDALRLRNAWRARDRRTVQLDGTGAVTRADESHSK